MAADQTAEVARYQKEASDYRKKHGDLLIKYQKVEAELTTLKAELQTVNAEKVKAVRYQKLGELQNKGFTFDVDEEIADCAEMNDAQFDRHCERIASKYQRVPGGVVTAGVKLASSQPVAADAKDSKKRDRYSKLAMDNVMASRAKSDRSERLDFPTEFNRLMDEDPEKIGA